MTIRSSGVTPTTASPSISPALPGTLAAAPTLGQHNEYVYKEILGMTDEQIGDLIAEGVITVEG